jgi:hypothetical protein
MRSTLPLVRGVYGRVNLCLIPSSTQSARNACDLKGDPLSVRMRVMLMSRPVNQATASRRKRQAVSPRSFS